MSIHIYGNCNELSIEEKDILEYTKAPCVGGDGR